MIMGILVTSKDTIMVTNDNVLCSVESADPGSILNPTTHGNITQDEQRVVWPYNLVDIANNCLVVFIDIIKATEGSHKDMTKMRI